VSVGARRSKADLVSGFTRWLGQHRPQWREPDVQLSRPQSGLSSETVFLDVRAHDGLHRLVARLPPVGEPLFPDYDLARQFQVQAALAGTTVPVAPPVAHEHDPSLIGAEFLLMPRVAGRTLTTAPPYVAAGWLHEAPAAEQADVLRRFLRTLAQIHRLPAHELGLGRLTGGGPDPASALDYWEHYLTWGTTDDDATLVYRDALAWCRAQLPAPVPASLLWGDPQLVNVVFDESGSAAAVLDWEMATVGPAEADLAWFLTLHEAAAETAGGDLPGFPDRTTVVEWYEVELGRPVRDLGWHEVFAQVRSGAIVLRIGELMRTAGLSASWTREVPQPRHLRRMIGV